MREENGMLVKTVHAVDFGVVFATCVWLSSTALIANTIVTQFYGLVATFVHLVAPRSLFIGL